MTTQRDRIAYHEAGHVTMALVDGLGLRSASIEPEHVVLTDWRRTVFSPTPHRSTRFYLGGFCAESRSAPSATRALNSRRDFYRARESLGAPE
jgi:hypothetical protein